MKKQKFLYRRKLVKATTITMALLIAATLISSSAVSVTRVSNTTNLNVKNTNPLMEFSVATDWITEDSAPKAMQPLPLSMLDWLHYDDGTCENALGLTAGGELTEAIRLTPTELAGYDGYEIQKVKVMHGWPTGTPQPAHDGFVRIWDAGTTTEPGALAKEQAFSAPAGNDWVEIDLLDPYIVDETQDVWVGVAFTHGAGDFPCGFDTDTVTVDKGGFLVYPGAAWTQLSAIGFPGNWNLWAGLEPGGPGPGHDVGVQSINEPSSGDAGIITPEVSVKNFGNNSEYDVPVNLKISKILPPTVVFSEGFEAPSVPIFPPVGWSIQSLSTSTWYKYSTGYARCAEDNTGAQDEWLITETFDCSALTGMTMRIGYHYMATPNDDYVEILGSTDDGSTWPNMIDNISAYSSGTKLYDISSWADGQSQVKITWRWVSSAATTGSDYFYFRDLDITSDTITLFDNYWFNDHTGDWGPNGWMEEDVLNMDSSIPPDPNIWRGADASYSTTPSADPYAGDWMAIYDTGLLYPQGSMARLYTPPMDLSAAGATMLTLKFMLHMNNYGSSYTDHVDIEVSTDGSTWTALDSISTYDASNPGWTEMEIDLSSYASETTFRLGFLGVDGGYRDIIIDNVVIEKPGLNLEYDETVLVDVPIGATVDVTFPLWLPDDWQLVENVDIDYSCVATQLLADDNPANDQKSKSATLHYPYLHDIAVISIDDPVFRGPGQTLPVEITLKNVGQNAECCYLANVEIGSKLYTDQWQTIVWGGTRDWQIYPYGDHSYEPSDCGTGDYYAGCYYTGGGTWDTSLVTYAFDLTSAGSSATIELCEEFQDFAGYGQFGIYVHSGGIPDASGAGSSNYEETLYYMTSDEIPRYGIYRVFNINPSLYTDPSQVYLEFWYTDDGYANAWGCGIDDLAIPEIGFYEDFEGSNFPPGSFTVIPEYDEDIMSITLDPGEEATLTYPDWTPDALGLGISGSIDYGIEAEQLLAGDTNPANDLLTAEITLDFWHDVKVEDITSPSGDKGAPGDILWNWDATVAHGDDQMLGIEWDGTYFYLTGAGGVATPDPNYVYRYEFDGTYVDRVAQTSAVGWGWRDIAYDGTHMYSSDSLDIVEWSITGPAGSPVLNIHNTYVGVSPVSPARALAYDPATDHFWTASFSSNFFEFDLTGTVYNSFINPWAGAYGMAWDDLSDDGPWLWVHDQGASQCIIQQVDPATGTGTGVTYTYTQGVAGGACMVDKNGLGQFVGVTQGTPDEAFGIEICETGPPGAPTPDIFILPGTQSIEALLENTGTFTESGMNVNAEIYEFITNVTVGTLVYDENYTTGTIDPLGGQETATFPDYTFDNIGGVYLLVITVTLGNDDMPDNNIMELGIGVDNVAPNSQHTIDPATPDGENGWYVSDVTVDFTAEDGTEVWQSGVDHIEYRVNGGSWQTGNSVTVTTDGEHTVQYKAIDEVGNEEAANSVEFKIDQTVPTVELKWESPDNVNVIFTATCSDATSGMDYVEFYLNDGLMFTAPAAPFEYTLTWSPTLKNAEFTAKGFDMAGLFATDMVTGIVPVPVPHGQTTPTPLTQQTNPL